MREIKFRGKRVDNGEWVYGYYARCNSDPDFAGGTYIIDEIRYNSQIGMCPHHLWEVDPNTVGQYTGKKVKTGKVFQDDIGKNMDGLFLVAWDEEKAAFVMHFYDYPTETLYLEEMWDDSEIIGNIHDNPELLAKEH